LVHTARWNWILACSVFLTACGGGGGGSTAVAPAPAPAPAPVGVPPDPVAIPTAVQFPARANDIKWSEQHRLLYLALPASNGPAGNRVVALDPHTNQAVYSQRSCSEPAALALSDDHQYLHVACNGSSSVQRFRLPELSLEREFFLGRDGMSGIPFRINDMVAVPGRPQSVVVALGTDAAGVAPSITRVYDDGVPRPVELGAITGGDCTSLGWDLTRTRLLCAKTASSAFALQEAALTADGLRVTRTASDVFRAFGVRMAVDPTSGMVYGDDGSVFDPAAWRLSGRTDLRGPVAPDSARNRLFVASPTERLVRSVDASTLAVTPTFAGGSAQPRRLIRWGATGLAMTTNGNSVIVYGGSGSSSFDTNTPRGTATERVLSVQIKQLIADPAGTLLYASVGPDAAEYANSVIAIDPYSGSVTRSRVLGRAPNALAVSGDGRFLYVGIDGAGTVQRLRLPSMDLDLTISLGQSPLYQLPYTAGLIRVSPAQPATVAVTRVLPNISSSRLGGVVILDDAVQRPIVAGGEASTTGFLFPSSLAWNDDGSSLYALDTFSNSLVSLAVSDAGVSLGARLGSVIDLVGALRFDKVNRLLSSDGGGVLDLTSGLPIGTYRRAFHLGPHQVQLGPAGTEVFTLYLNQPAEFAPVSEIAVYDATKFLIKKIYTIPGSDELITYDFVQLRPGWFAFRSSKGVHIVQLAL
jgi:hypothetical protein